MHPASHRHHTLRATRTRDMPVILLQKETPTTLLVNISKSTAACQANSLLLKHFLIAAIALNSLHETRDGKHCYANAKQGVDRRGSKLRVLFFWIRLRSCGNPRHTGINAGNYCNCTRPTPEPRRGRLWNTSDFPFATASPCTPISFPSFFGAVGCVALGLRRYHHLVPQNAPHERTEHAGHAIGRAPRE